MPSITTGSPGQVASGLKPAAHHDIEASVTTSKKSSHPRTVAFLETANSVLAKNLSDIPDHSKQGAAVALINRTVVNDLSQQPSSQLNITKADAFPGGVISHRIDFGQHYKAGSITPGKVIETDPGTCHASTLAWIRNIESRDELERSLPNALEAELLQYRLYHKDEKNNVLVDPSIAIEQKLESLDQHNLMSSPADMLKPENFAEMKKFYQSEGFEFTEKVGAINAHELHTYIEELKGCEGRYSYLLYTNTHVAGLTVKGDQVGWFDSARGYKVINFTKAIDDLQLYQAANQLMADSKVNEVAVVRIGYHADQEGITKTVEPTFQPSAFSGSKYLSMWDEI